jgi:amino acid permease
MLVPVPLTFPRTNQHLKYTSTIFMVSILLFCIALIIKAIINLPYGGEHDPNVIIAKGDMDIFQAISVYSLAFAYPCVVIPNISPYDQDFSKRKFAIATTVILCFIAVTLPGILRYLLFGSFTWTIVL